MQVIDFFKCLPWAQQCSIEDLQDIERSEDARLHCALDRAFLKIFSSGEFIPLHIKPIVATSEHKICFFFKCEIWLCTKRLIGGLLLKVDGDYYLINHTAIEAIKIVKKRKREHGSGPTLSLSWPAIDLHFYTSSPDDIVKGISSEKSIELLSTVVEKMSRALNTERLMIPISRNLSQGVGALTLDRAIISVADSLKWLSKTSAFLAGNRTSCVSDFLVPDSTSAHADKKTIDFVAGALHAISRTNFVSNHVLDLEREACAEKKILTQNINNLLDNLFFDSEDDHKEDTVDNIIKCIDQIKRCESSIVMTMLLPRV